MAFPNDYNPPPIIQKPLPIKGYSKGRAGTDVIAIVNHRMVGTLPGTTAHFQNPDTRQVSTHFGIGFVSSGRLEIHQYVKLDDTAYGNGNFHESARWDNWGKPTTAINARTISIEHQDHYNPGVGKGVVHKDIINASMWLQALLLRADPEEIYHAGVRFADNGAPRFKVLTALKHIGVNERGIVTHHDIAGDLKPFCWLPWAEDRTGFPRSLYLATIPVLMRYPGAILDRDEPEPQTPPVVVPPVTTYTQAQLDSLIKAEREKNMDAWATADAALLRQVEDIEARLAQLKVLIKS